MNLALKIVNGLVALLIAAVIFNLDKRTGSVAEGVGYFIGASLWLIAPVSSIFALGERASSRLRTFAVWMNVLEAIGFLYFGLFFRKSELTIALLVGALIVVSPFIANVIRIRMLSARSSQGEDAEPVPEPVPAPTPLAWNDEAQEEPAERRNYFVRHWRGDLSLPVSYWVNGTLIGIALFPLNKLIGATLEDASMRRVALTAALMIVVQILVWIWSSVGIWRSAGKHADRGGAAGWGSAARVATGIGVLMFATIFVNNLYPQLKELSAIAAGLDPIGKINVRITEDGTVIVLKGNFGSGSAEEVGKVIASAKKLRVVSLESHGGRLREAADIAKAVRERHLDTYVEGYCESACTYIFLAGVDRAATPNAKIGFHSPDFPGFDANTRSEMTEKMLNVYRSYNISGSFLERVAKTKTADMWYPTRDELIDNGVINRVSLGGETQAAMGAEFRSREELGLKFQEIPLLKKLESRFPGTLDRAADSAWKSYRMGSKDADVLSAARQELAAVFPKLLAEADDQLLAEFLELSLAQLTAARNVSYDACSALLGVRLNASQVLPKEVNDQENRWLMKAIDTEPLTRGKVDALEFQQIAQDIIGGMRAELVDIIGDLEAHADKPELQCDAAIEFYEGVKKLPKASQTLALRGMFQGTTE
jgi:hypothetical protein